MNDSLPAIELQVTEPLYLYRSSGKQSLCGVEEPIVQEPLSSQEGGVVLRLGYCLSSHRQHLKFQNHLDLNVQVPKA